MSIKLPPIASLADGLLFRERRIALTGIADGGKTVFLTSLISHLVEHEPALFAFGRGARISQFREVPDRTRAGEPFRFSAYRDRLSRLGQWPAKTRDSLHYACEFRRSDWRLYGSRLHFFDFPGERVADAAIAAMPDFGEWSDHILRYLADHSAYEERALPYLALQECAELDLVDIIHAWKRTLTRLVHAYLPLITPSTFLLAPDGSQAGRDLDEDGADARPAGLPAGEDGAPAREFAPLGAAARERHPELAAALAEAYHAYRRELVLPLYRELGRAHRLIVLIDIPMLLTGGVGRYNDNRQILTDLMEALRPDSSLGGRLMRLLGWGRPLDRVALVASKSDLVHPDDIAEGRLDGLLRAMTERARGLLPGVEFETFVCAAAQSTFAGARDHTLVGRVVAAENPERELAEFTVPPLPEVWPDDWPSGQYRFCRVHPDFPRNHQVPPRQIGLDRVFDFVTRE